MILVLGSTPQDRGQQLESLTLTLLRLLGYVDCTTNLHASGSEIDVQGRLPRPTVGSISYRTLLCECKAHQSSIDMTQWCKFLGKIYHAEALEGHEVHGCFISLSGVNGHVQGHFDSLARHKDTVSLIHGDRLGELVRNAFQMVSVESISRQVAQLTPRVVISFSTAFYNGTAYWVVGFSDGAFTLLGPDSTPLSAEQVDAVSPLVVQSTEMHTHVDLLAEQAAQIRNARARTHVIATLFLNHGVFQPGIDAFPPTEDFTPNELAAIARLLIQEGFVTVRGDGIPILSQELHGAVIHVSARVYRELFQVACPIAVLGCEFYDSGVSHNLLNEICEIQGGLILSHEERERVLELLRLSPTGLRTALVPIQMIVESVRQGVRTPAIERFRTDHFLETLLKCLRSDFARHNLAEYFFTVRGLRELDLTTRVIAKSASEAVLDLAFRERIGVGAAHESIGGGYVHVALLANAPEPWEPGGVCIPSAADIDETGRTGVENEATSLEPDDPPATT